MAAPRLGAQVFSAPHDQVMRDLQAARPDSPVRSEAVIEALKARRAALAWHFDPRLATELGGFQLALSSAYGYESETGRFLLDAAIESHVEGLAGDPAQPFAWARLARAKFAREGMSPDLNGLLRMAVRTAPREPQLVLDRLDLAFAVWSALDNTTRKMMHEQIVIAARYYEKRLGQVAKRHYALPILADALKDDEALFVRVGFHYRRAPAPHQSGS